MLSPTELIVTNMLSNVSYVHISSCSQQQIAFEQKQIQTEIDSKNYQILGLGTSGTGTLWSMLVFRNKEYANKSKFGASCAFLKVCKLSNSDALAKLDCSTVPYMNMVKDYLLVINLDILNNQDIDKYNDYLNLVNLKLPTSLNCLFRQKLQIKLLTLRHKGVYQR